MFPPKISFRKMPCFVTPDNLVLKVIEAKNLVKHYFHIMTCVPVAVIVETSGFFEDSIHFEYPETHMLNICFRVSKSIFKCSFLLNVTPKYFIVPVTIERRVNIN